MATESVLRIKEEADRTWQPSTKHESLHDRATRKLMQAEALAHCLVGDDLADPFENCHDVLRQNIRWLLADTITEAREAYDQANSEKRG